MADKFEKQDDNTLKVTRAPVAIPEVKSYDFDFLKSQRAQILVDQARVAKELAAVDALIAQATTLGFAEKPKEAAPK